MGLPVPHGLLDEPSVAVIGEIGAVPVPGTDVVSFPVRGSLGSENGGEVSLDEVPFEAVTGEFRVLLSAPGDESMMVVPVVVNVRVRVSGRVIVDPPVTGAVGAVFHGKDSLHGVGNTGLPSVDKESPPDGAGKYP